jgi:hypothetical protein
MHKSIGGTLLSSRANALAGGTLGCLWPALSTSPESEGNQPLEQ